MIARLIVLLIVTLSLHAQQNLDLEMGSEGATPTGWIAPVSAAEFKVSWTNKHCLQGSGCATITPTSPNSKPFGNMMQNLDATPFRGKRVRLRAAVRTEGNGQAQLWLRNDLAGGGSGFFDNMQDRPARTQGQWQHVEINGFINAETRNIAFGVMAVNGAIAVDDVSISITGDLAVLPSEGPRPISPEGVTNLQAFARLYGLVRHFHPSDEVAAADWNRIAIDGVRKVENTTDLAKTLGEIFLPVAPTLRVFTGKPPALDLPKTGEMLRLQHRGFGQTKPGYNVYNSQRIPASSMEFHTVDLGLEVKAIVPLSVYKDASGTLPHGTKATEELPLSLYSLNDRATRLGGVIIAWNIFQHFYPYFDVAGTDWNAILPTTLARSAKDADRIQFQSTLRRMVAALKDGHGNVYSNGGTPFTFPPLTAAWIENKYVVTTAAPDIDVKPGDEIIAVKGKSAGLLLAELEEEISSATPQWARSRAVINALQCTRGAPLGLTVRPFGAKDASNIIVPCNTNYPTVIDNRPTDPTSELHPRIWYVDVTRISDKEFQDILPKLIDAKGIVFDIRGYPKITPQWLTHLTETPMKSANWDIPLIDRPGHMEFTRGGWPVNPQTPYLKAKRVFLTNGGAISYAETTMGIIEFFKLGEILGEATAGTNGNVNPFQLPGGFNVSWTGMKVVKHDGTRHHGVGIQPTIPVAHTQSGVAAGRDEILERSLAILRQ